MQGGFENLRSKKGAKGAFRYLSSLFVPGMVTQLDRDVAGTLMNSSLGSIVSLSDQYNYDAFGRFDNHTHQIAGNTEYTLDMSYNKAGGIIQKDALATWLTDTV